MTKKIIFIAVAGVLAGGSFGVSYILFKSPAPQPLAKTPATNPATQPGVLAQLPEGPETAWPLAAKEAQLDNLAKELRARIAEYQQRTRKLDEQEKRIKVAQTLLDKNAAELANLQLSLMDPLRQIKEAQAALDNNRVLIRQQEKANLKRIASSYETMDATQASEIIERMCTSQQEDLAVRILYLMNGRSVGKVLAGMQDKALAAKLTEKMKRIQEEA